MAERIGNSGGVNMYQMDLAIFRLVGQLGTT